MEHEINPPPGYALRSTTLEAFTAFNDAAQCKPGQVMATVCATKFTDSIAAYVDLSLSTGGFDARSHMKPATARIIAASLIEAANICDAYEAAQATPPNATEAPLIEALQA